MTPAARIETASSLLDMILEGTPAEKVLTNWARKSRFAGSKDRVAVRDHVFEALRCKRSFAALGGAMTGRGLMIGALRAVQGDVSSVYSGDGYGPSPLTDEEAAGGYTPEDFGERLDIPDWLIEMFQTSLGEKSEENAFSMRQRAPVFLRVNTSKTNLEEVVTELSLSEIEARAHPISPTALEVVKNPRRVANSQEYLDGLVELQDGASQAVCDQIELRDGMKILDYCAGGGGKSLALAARAAGYKNVKFYAHDVNPARLKDLDARAERAGARIKLLETSEIADHGPYDVVLCDVPCSGSGAWRRAPEGKWALTQERLEELNDIQSKILETAQHFVAQQGVLAYATCSVFHCENQDRIAQFLSQSSGWGQTFDRQWLMGSTGDGGDGFFSAHLSRA